MKFFAFLIPFLSAQAPIPNRPSGWVYDPNGKGFIANPIEVQVHLDLQCPDCLMAWDALKQMANHYERSVKLSIVDFPLPYHRAAFKVAIGLQAVGNSKTAPAGPFDYMDLMFEKQDEIHSFADTANDTMLIGKLVDLMSQSSKFSKYADEFAKEMVNEENDWLARVDWKYACSVGTSGTPFPYVNRVFLDQGIADFKLEDWKKIIDPMLKNDYQAPGKEVF